MSLGWRGAARRLLERPTATWTVVATLALGVGATTAVFSLLDTVVLRPLPYPEPDRILRVGVAVPGQSEMQEVSWPKLETLEDASADSLEVAAWYQTTLGLTDRGESSEIVGARVSSGFLAVWGVDPIVGRDFSADEQLPGGTAVALLSEGFWQSRFAADRDIVGRVITIDGRPTTVIGVLPSELSVAFRDVQLWLPRPGEADFIPPETIERGAGYLDVGARLRADGTIAAAQDLLDRVAESYARQRPGQFDGTYRLVAVDLGERLLGKSRSALTMLLGAALLLLVIACADVAGLLLADSLGRGGEMAVRAALGAEWRHLTSQLLAESLLVGGLGGALGLVGAGLALGLVRGYGPPDLPRLEQAALTPRAMAVALGATCAVALCALLAPALRATRSDPATILLSGGHRATESVAGGRAQRSLVACQIALTLVLLSSALLLVRSWRAVDQLQLGFDPEGLLAVEITLPAATYPDPAARRTFFQGLLERVRGAAGVQGAALAEYAPTLGAPHVRIEVVGREPQSPEEQLVAQRLIVSPGYLATMRARLAAGRDLGLRETPGAPPTALVSRSLSERLFAGSSPLGQRVLMRGSDEPIEIVGVVEDLRQQPLELDFEPTIYLSQFDVGTMLAPPNFATLLVRASGGSAGIADVVRTAVRDLDRSQPMGPVIPMRSLLARATARRRMIAGLVGAFSLTAMMLAILGVYGVVERAIATRRRETALRIALGATPANVVTELLARAARWLIPGLVVGVLGALAAGRMLAGQLFGVDGVGPLHLVAVSALLAMVTFAALWKPSRRAARCAPARTLRGEGGS